MLCLNNDQGHTTPDNERIHTSQNEFIWSEIIHSRNVSTVYRDICQSGYKAYPESEAEQHNEVLHMQH